MREVRDQLDPPGRRDRAEIARPRAPGSVRAIASIRRGVNAALTRPRTRVWSGGSRCAMPDREVLVEGREQALLEARRPLDRQRHPAGGGEALGVADGRLDVGGTGDQPAAPGSTQWTGEAARKRAKTGYGSARKAGVPRSASSPAAARSAARSVPITATHRSYGLGGARESRRLSRIGRTERARGESMDADAARRGPDGLLRHHPDDVPRRRRTCPSTSTPSRGMSAS